MANDLADFFNNLVNGPSCTKCHGRLDIEDEYCRSCGTRNPQWNTLHRDKCPGCLFRLEDASDKYCRLCGASVVEGTYSPMQSEWEYGSFDFPPVERKHICYQCGFTYYSGHHHDNYRFRPRCGGHAPAL